jgi:hypothetical protein
LFFGGQGEMKDWCLSTGSNEWCFFGKKGDGFRAAVI